MSRLQWFLLVNGFVKLAIVLLFRHLHPAAGITLFFLPDLWLGFQLLAPNARGFVPVVSRFETHAREVWLTIDDGPDPGTTRRVLALLAGHRARATFFLIGERAAAQPELVTEILRQGHGIANHTQHHPLSRFAFLSQRKVRAQIDDGTAALRACGVSRLDGFRPPAGVKSIFLPALLQERGLPCIGWTARGRESFAVSTEKPLARLKRGLRPGAILLAHESSPNAELRLALISALLAHLTAEGYACVVPPRHALR